jgi:deoxyribose-phosphate aldolase
MDKERKRMMMMTRAEFAQTFDFSILKPTATPADILVGCRSARENGFKLLMVQPRHTALAVSELAGSGVLVGAVLGFPHGADLTEAKAFSADRLRFIGADELDMVMDLGAFKAGDYTTVIQDITAVVNASAGAPVKVILETCELSKDEIVKACQLVQQAGAQFVKTSTGFAAKGADAADVRLMRDTVGPAMGVKASGGIRTLEQALILLEAGANRIGVSAGEALLAEWDAKFGN